MAITTLPQRSSDPAPASRVSALGVSALCLAGATAVGAALASASAYAQTAPGTPSLPVVSPSVLPATGTGGFRSGDLRSAVSSLLASGPLPGAGPAWIVSPSIGIDAGVTDNVYEITSPRRADVFTDITPSISLTGDTARLQVNANYSPVISLFAQTPSRNIVSNYLSGDAFATVVPDLFYVDLRANITQSSITGGYGGYGVYGGSGAPNNGTQYLNGQDQVETSTVSFTPYLVHRFDGWGTGRLSYSLTYTAQNGYGTNTNVPLASGSAASGTAPYPGYGVNPTFLGNQNLLTNSELAQFISGENLGRTNLGATISLQQFSGNGVYGSTSSGSSYENIYAINGAYALTRSIAAIGEVGYENLRYDSIPVVQVNAPVWQAGVRWEPNADSTISLGYGERDGVSSFFLNASYAPTARTRVYATYSAGISSAAQDQQALLQSAVFGPGGLATSAVTGAPLITTGNAFGTQNALYRARRFSITGVLLRPRDTYSLSVVNEDDTVLAGFTTSGAGAGGSYGGTYVQFSWQHDLSPVVSTNLFVQYGSDSTQTVTVAPGSNTSEQFVAVNASANWILSQSVTGYVNYSLGSRFGSPVPGRDYVENIALVGLRKAF